ncbi:MAG: Cytochrome c-type biogenesis protein CcmH [Alphaproteobacteria bacterium MarineAlpha5_Bin9]|nr:MAG: Cytochrome c-type biogenesis protein CcmH [Alphaproteobacteria bacterium MarineAlpha5_Bin9]|tara:strand:- start:39147 stop:39506 length:360 start_codon:yes stop_codon:yes gene_type:complete
MKILISLIIILLSLSLFAEKSNHQTFIELTKNLRCMTCQNQSIHESDAEFSLVIKKIVKDKLKQGESKEDIEDFLVQRYGEYILFEPMFNYKNLFLWVSPFFILILSGFILFINLKRNR